MLYLRAPSGFVRNKEEKSVRRREQFPNNESPGDPHYQNSTTDVFTRFADSIFTYGTKLNDQKRYRFLRHTTLFHLHPLIERTGCRQRKRLDTHG